ncbi:MAG TPA: FecR domain-containing protein [Puia sp.]
MENFMDIDRIILKYIREEELSVEETVLLQQWIKGSEGREEMIRNFREESPWVQEELKEIQKTPQTRIWDKVAGMLEDEGHWAAPVVPSGAVSTSQSIGLWRYLVAATVLLAVSGAALWFAQQHKVANVPTQPTIAQTNDVEPGSNRAVLTLSNGQTINLDNSQNGVVASQGNMNVTKLADGQLAYNKASDEKTTAALYNVLTTPRAGQFSLTLPDGSKVWLNNATTLRYPVSFSGNSREVELNGEAYFEIAKDASHPFRVAVHKGGQNSTIEVLGTSFNIMAYEDEGAQRTTLVEGSVRFVHEGASALLKPEEQSVLDPSGNIKTLRHVDVAEVTAWKNGFFHFDHASLETTMRQLARWYDIDVEYNGTVKPQEYMGKIQRNLPLSAVLKGLTRDDIHFELEGRKLVVKP